MGDGYIAEPGGYIKNISGYKFQSEKNKDKRDKKKMKTYVTTIRELRTPAGSDCGRARLLRISIIRIRFDFWEVVGSLAVLFSHHHVELVVGHLH